MILNIIISLALLNLILSYFTKKRNVLYCGLVGFSGKEDFDLDKIKMLMLANMWRGYDSTGLWTPADGLSKQCLRVDEYLGYIGHLITPGNLFMGHVRKATIGGANDPKNAHPFHVEELIGMHNGTLTNHHSLAREIGLKYTDYDVDSQVLLNGLKNHGDYEILKDIEGAAALVWTYVDREEDELYIYRNEHRPLWRGFADEGMYISSTEESLKIIGCRAIKEFKTNYLYVIEEGTFMSKVSKVIKKRKKHEVKTPSRASRHVTTCTTEIDENAFETTPSAPIISIEDSAIIGKWAQVETTSNNKSLVFGEMYQITEVFTNGILGIADKKGINVIPREDCTIRDFPSTGSWALCNVKGGWTEEKALVYVVSEQILPDEKTGTYIDWISYNIVGGEDIGTIRWEPQFFAEVSEEEAFKIDVRAKKTPQEYIKKIDPSMGENNDDSDEDDEEIDASKIQSVTDFYRNLIKFKHIDVFDETGDVLGDRKALIGSSLTDILSMISVLEVFENDYFNGEEILVSDIIMKLGNSKLIAMETINTMVDNVLEEIQEETRLKEIDVDS